MKPLNFTTGPYSFAHLLETLATQAPGLLSHIEPLGAFLFGPDRIPLRTLVVLYMRLAHLMGCPVCKWFFPMLARRMAFSDDEIHEALGGPEGFLRPEEGAAASFAESVLRAGGELPTAAPEVPPSRVEQIQTYVRMEMIIHAIGLMFLPDGVTRQARERDRETP